MSVKIEQAVNEIKETDLLFHMYWHLEYRICINGKRKGHNTGDSIP